MPPPTPTAYWNFESLTTNGFETDLDQVASLPMWSRGDEGAVDPDAVPCPTVAGKSGNGRLLASASLYNAFGTGSQAAGLAYTTGNPISVSFWCRPLLEFNFPFPFNNVLLGIRQKGGTGGLGFFLHEFYIENGSSAGEIDINAVISGGGGRLSAIPFALRTWHLVNIVYDGVTTITIYVDGVSAGTVSIPLVIPTCAWGELLFIKDILRGSSFLILLDEVGIWMNHELSPGEITDIVNGWTHP